MEVVYEFLRMNKLLDVKNKINEELNKFYKLFNSEVEDLLRDSTFVAGGCIYSLYNTSEFKDIDIFFKNKESFSKVTTYIMNDIEFLVTGEKEGIKIGTYKGNRVVITGNAVSIGHYQLISRDIGSCEEVVDQFDFKHNMFYLDKDEIKTRSSFRYLDDEVLRFNNERARDICGTIMRTIKYSERGMKVQRSEMARMLLQLNEVGFSENELLTLHSLDEERLSFGS